MYNSFLKLIGIWNLMHIGKLKLDASLTDLGFQLFYADYTGIFL